MNTEFIGTNAGILWSIMNSRNRMWSIKELRQASGLSDAEVYTALGWLAREDKLEFGPKEDPLHFGLKAVIFYF